MIFFNVKNNLKPLRLIILLPHYSVIYIVYYKFQLLQVNEIKFVIIILFHILCLITY